MAEAGGSMRSASLLALVLGLALGATGAQAGNFTFTSVDDDHIAWADAANWAGPGPLPTDADNATISAGLLRGAEVKDTRGVNSLVLDSGINIYLGGELAVGNGITANAGYFINDGIVVSDVVNNTYIASTGTFTGTLTNGAAGAFINDGTPGHIGRFVGDVDNAGFLVNSSGTWTGNVLSNTSFIINEKGAVWTGDVNNSADLISTDSTWNGDLINSGVAQLTGMLNGNVVNTGTVWMNGSLEGVGTIVSTGRLGLEDGAADDTLTAKSLSGAGVLTVDFDLATMTSDKVVLSGDYSGTTDLDLRIIGAPPSTRQLGAAQIIVVGGKDTGTVTTAADLGSRNGAIVYELAQSADGWAIVAAPGDASLHVADALALTAATLGTAAETRLAPGAACGPAASFRGLHSTATSATANIDVAGALLGFDLACLALPQSSATLGIGLTLGLASGAIGGDTSGTVDQRFAGLSAKLVDGAFSAILEGQLAGTNYFLADPVVGLGTTTLAGLSSRLSGSASYALALGAITLAPELGLSLSASDIGSNQFGNAGAVRFGSGPALSAQIGTTLTADLALDGATLTPFASVMLHGDVHAPNPTFTDSAGTTAALAIARQGPYAALTLGANLLHDGTLDAGLRADLKLGAQIHDVSVSGHLKVSY